MIHRLFTHVTNSILLSVILIAFMAGATLQAQESHSITVIVKTPTEANRLRASDVDIKLYARPITDGAKTRRDVLLKVISIQPIRSVSSGRTSSYKVKVELPANITRAEYGLWAYVDAGNTVTESNIGSLDLTIKFGRVTLPQRIVSGGKGVARFPVIITNKGDLAAVRGQRMDIKIIARPAGKLDDSEDVTVATAANESIGNMEPGESIKTVLIGEFPGQLPVQSYNLIAMVDSGHAVAERDENNNTAQLPDTIAVTGQNVDLLVDLNNVQLPKGIVSGAEKQISVPIKISNAGNLGFDLDQTVDVKVFARPALNIDDPSDDVLLAFSSGNSLAKLSPGKSMALDIQGKIPATLAKGTYTLRVLIDPLNRVKEANEDNNTAMLLEPLSVLAKVVDLEGQLMEARAPRRVISGQTPLLVMPVRITNSGSVPFESDTQSIGIQLIARPDDALDQSGDIILNQIKDRPISGLMPKQSMIVNLDTPLPTDMTPGRYKIIIVVDSGHVIDEADETNNTPEYATTLAVEKPFVDLVAGIVTLRPARAIVSGSNHVLTVPVKIKNAGNVRPNANVPVNIRVSARPFGALDKATNDVELGTIENLNLGMLEPGTEQMFQAQAKFPARMPAGKYILVAHVDCQAVVVEPDDENNYAVAPIAHALEIAAPRMDLAADIVNLNLPTSVIAGQKQLLSLPVKIINQGNIALPADQYVDLKVSARLLGTTGDQDIDLALDIDKPVASLAPGESLTFTPVVSIPSNVEAGKYLLVAHIDPTNKLKEQDEENNILAIATGQAFDVVSPVIDLVADIVNPSLPPSTVAGHGPNAMVPVQITNAGNVATASDLAIDIKIYAKAIDGDKLIEVATQPTVAIGSLQSGQSITSQVSARIPSGVAMGKYVLVAMIDTTDVAKETSEKNNTVATSTANAILVAEPFIDLAVTIDSINHSRQAIAGHSQPVETTVSIVNLGNIPTASKTKLTASLFCTADGGKRKIKLALLNDIAAGGIKPGQAMTLKAKGSFPETLAAGRYVLGVSLQNSGDTNPQNDQAMQVSANAISVAKPFVDLAVTIDSTNHSRQAIAGHSQPVETTFSIVNLGNIPIKDQTQLHVSLFCTTDDGKSKIQLAELDDIAISNLMPGQTISRHAKGSFPATLAAGRYILGVALLNSRQAGDTQAVNDQAIQVVANAINVARPFIDLALTLDPVSLPGTAIAGHGRAIKLPIRLTNQGNIALPSSMPVNLRVHAVSAKNAQKRVVISSIEAVEVGSLKAGQSILKIATVNLPVKLQAGQYILTAQIDPTTAQGDIDPANNRASTVRAHAIDVVVPFVDIAASIISPNLPSQVIAGHGPSFVISLNITNQGNVPLPENQKLSISTYAKSVDKAGHTIRVNQQNFDVNSLGAGISKVTKLKLIIPSSVQVGLYQLQIQVQPVGDELDEVSQENNTILTTASEAIQVVAPFVDLVGQFDSAKLPRQIVAGHANDITVPIHITNQGNIALREKDAIGIKLFARPIDRKAKDITLATISDQSLANLGAGSVKTLLADVQFPPAMRVGRYLVGLAIDTASQVSESNETNNNQLADQGLAMQVDAPTTDIIGSLEIVRPSSGIILESQQISIYLKLANRGNVTLPSDQTVDVMLYARPVSLGKLADMDLKIGRMASLKIGDLAPGLERTFRHQTLISTTNMPTDDYIILAKIDSADVLKENDESNNLAMDTARVVALGRRFRIKNMPVPFDSDGPRRYKVSGIKIQYRGLPASPSVEQLKILEMQVTKSYAGLVAQRYEEESTRMTLKELSEVQETYLYRSVVRVLCARIAEHLEHLGKKGMTVRPAPEQIDAKGEDLRPKGQLGLTIVIEKSK